MAKVMKRFLPFLVMLLSHISFAQWIQTTEPYDRRSINVLGVYGSMLFAGIEGGGVFVTDDFGNSWSTMGKGLTESHISSLTVSNNNLFVGTQMGVFLFNSNDSSWTPLGPFTNYIKALASSDTMLFAATSGSGVYRSTNSGTSWTPVNSGLEDLWVRNLSMSNGGIFAGTQSKGVYRSTNNGTSWSAVNTGLEGLWVYSLMAHDSAIFVGTSEGIFYSTDNGAMWYDGDSGITANIVTCFAEHDGVSFAGTAGNGVFLSNDHGIHWTAWKYGLNNGYVSSLTAYGEFLFAGTGQDWIWRRSLSELMTTVERSEMQSPDRLVLHQNYPNPFNPTTTISFSLPSRSFVSLKVLDVIGREITTLVYEELSAGDHTRQWTPSNMSSGVYFYRLQAGSFSETKELILMR